MTDKGETIPQQPRAKRRRLFWLWLALATIVILIYLGSTVTVGYWDGAVVRTIEVHVASNDSGAPLSNATVMLTLPRDEFLLAERDFASVSDQLRREKRLAVTDERGNASIVGQFGAGGRISLLWRSRSFDADGYLRVSHPGFRTSEDLLPNYLGARTFSTRSKPLRVRIVLAPM
jgi:hypothetical protein